MTTEHSGVTDLDVHECWALIRSAEVGRLAVVIGNQPEIFPINFVVDHGSVVFRTAAGTKLAALSDSERVAFEVDGYAPRDRQAWSVVVKGRANKIRALHELFDAHTLPLFPWHAAPKQHFVRIVPDTLTGRRFAVVDPAPTEPPFARRAAHE
ncbi:MAG: pyridoxamine 5'-phosphate oxidase family protein [Mycobacteriales bacterium]